MNQRRGMGMEVDAPPAAPALSFSLLRISVPARLAIATAMTLLLWVAVLWALA